MKPVLYFEVHFFFISFCFSYYYTFVCFVECPNDKFPCNNGECIQQSLFCDGLADCGDKTDEPTGCGGACGKHEFRCANRRCIAKSRVCNGMDNCGDMSDELNCPNVRTSWFCLPKNQKWNNGEIKYIRYCFDHHRMPYFVDCKIRELQRLKFLKSEEYRISSCKIIMKLLARFIKW